MPPKRIPPSLKRKLYADRQPTLDCPYCDRTFRNLSGLSQHKNSAHPSESLQGQQPPDIQTTPPDFLNDIEDPPQPAHPSEPIHPTLFRDIHPDLNGLSCSHIPQITYMILTHQNRTALRYQREISSTRYTPSSIYLNHTCRLDTVWESAGV